METALLPLYYPFTFGASGRMERSIQFCSVTSTFYIYVVDSFLELMEELIEWSIKDKVQSDGWSVRSIRYQRRSNSIQYKTYVRDLDVRFIVNLNEMTVSDR